MGMLATTGVIVSEDTFGPVSDNAAGIAEMSGEFHGEPERIMVSLDAVGNTTKAVTKGFAIGSAVIAAVAIFASFVAIAQLIQHGKEPSIDGGQKALLAGLGILTIIVSWSVTQVAFALHYAHDYYLPDGGSDAQGGLDFPGTEMPDYWDFLYFATSIGATSQTSDTTIKSHSLRRLVTLHSVIAFFFNTAVLALTVNIAASLA